jgi:phage terminase large subunit
LAAKARPIAGDNAVWCDSAEPKSIQELRQQGDNSINSQPVIKGKDSVWHAIQWLQQWTIVIDKKCINTINEFSSYQWMKNRQGENMNVPVSYNDHTISALRYATERDRLGMQCAIVT